MDATAQESAGDEYIEVQARVLEVHPDRNALTVEFDRTQARETLTLNESTQIRLEGRYYTIRDARLAWIEPGDEVSLGYIEEDAAKKLMSFERNRSDSNVEGDFIEVNARVVSVEPEQRTVTVEFDRTEARETLHLSEDTQLRLEGRYYTIQDAKLGWLEPGDAITLGYVTEGDMKHIMTLERHD